MKTIIFDFDGTLVDTQAVVIMSFKETVTKAGYPEPADAECTRIIGLAIDDCFKTMLGCGDVEARRLSEIYKKDVFPKNIQRFKVKPFPGVIETLEQLKAKGFTIAVATSRGKESAEELIPLSGVGQYVSLIVTPQDVEKGKPAPDTAIKILEEFHANPEETIVVGDAPFDVLMGKNACCKTCAVTYGNGSVEDLEQSGPDYIIDDIRKIMDII